MACFIHNLHFLADSEMLRGRLASARQASGEVAVKHPRNARFLVGLHESLIKQGRRDDAVW